MPNQNVQCIFCGKNFRKLSDVKEHFVKEHWAYRNEDFLLTSCLMSNEERERVMDVIVNKTKADKVSKSEKSIPQSKASSGANINQNSAGKKTAPINSTTRSSKVTVKKEVSNNVESPVKSQVNNKKDTVIIPATMIKKEIVHEVTSVTNNKNVQERKKREGVPLTGAGSVKKPKRSDRTSIAAVSDLNKQVKAFGLSDVTISKPSYQQPDDVVSDLNKQIMAFVQSMKNKSNKGKQSKPLEVEQKDTERKPHVDTSPKAVIVPLKSYGIGGMTIWKCTVCERESADKSRLQKHYDTAHV